MRNLDFVDKINMAKERIETPEHQLAMGLLQPSNICSSGARKNLAITQRQQVMPIMEPERQITGTGFEEKYGDESSSIRKADQDYRVVAKIDKFSMVPNHHYWLILANDDTKTLSVETRIAYKHIVQSYGYLYNNNGMDSVDVGDWVGKGHMFRSSTAYDKYNNRCDGINATLMYQCLDQNMEDSVIVSDRLKYKMASPLIHPPERIINQNTIPLNLYGSADGSIYKVCPDIGEKVRDDGLLLALRTQQNEDSTFIENIERLRQPMITDEPCKCHGTLIDIDVLCNDPEALANDCYAGQLKYYYDERLRVDREFLLATTNLISQGYKATPELQELIGLAKLELNGAKYVEQRSLKGKPYSYLKVKFVVLEILPLSKGDKITNMYGSKGIISKIVPEQLMPYTESGERVDIILQAGGMTNRENVNQCGEHEYSFISRKILEYICENNIDDREALEMIHRYYQIVAPKQASKLEMMSQLWGEDELAYFIDSCKSHGFLDTRALPASEAYSIFKLQALYEAFPFVDLEWVYSAWKNSNGEYKFHKGRRPTVVGKEYFWRLKQFAEEKFSATSLSSTNIRNQNTKSKSNKVFRRFYADTPVRNGNMEMAQLSDHMGAEVMVANLMIHSVSPHAKLLAEQFYTKDPYNTNLKLDEDSKNRSAEEVVTYMKTIGLRLCYKKKRRRVFKPFMDSPFTPLGTSRPEPIVPWSTIKEDGFDFVKAGNEILENEKRILNDSPFIYVGDVDTEIH